MAHIFRKLLPIKVETENKTNLWYSNWDSAGCIIKGIILITKDPKCESVYYVLKICLCP